MHSGSRHFSMRMSASTGPGYLPNSFPAARRIVALMSMGIVVRGIAPLIRDKWTDPAVVVVTPDFAFAVPLLGGHHGANELAKELSALGLVPVISTATEATGLDSAEAIADRTGLRILSTAIRPVRSMPGSSTARQDCIPCPARGRHCRPGRVDPRAPRRICDRHRLPQRSYDRRSDIGHPRSTGRCGHRAKRCHALCDHGKKMQRDRPY